jgi:hypothetical protein
VSVRPERELRAHLRNECVDERPSHSIELQHTRTLLDKQVVVWPTVFEIGKGRSAWDIAKKTEKRTSRAFIAIQPRETALIPDKQTDDLSIRRSAKTKHHA